jgi:predicted nucleic acid-binding protein
MPVTEDTAQRYALILNDLRRSRAIIPTNDIWIAATAMEHGLRLLTTDSHYERVRQVAVSCFNSISC